MDVVGGIKVSMANKVFVRVRSVGERESKKIRIAIVSPNGQDHSIVSTRLRTPLSYIAGLLAALMSILRWFRSCKPFEEPLASDPKSSDKSPDSLPSRPSEPAKELLVSFVRVSGNCERALEVAGCGVWG